MNPRAYIAVIQPESVEPQVGMDDFEPGPFPIDALNPVQRQIAWETADVHQIDPALPGMATIATLAAAVGKGHVVQGAVNGRTTYCNLFVLAGAPKSYGKNAASSITEPLVQASRCMADTFREHELPTLLREKHTLEARFKVMVRRLANPAKGREMQTECDQQQMEQRLDEMQARIAEISTLTSPLPSYWISSATTAGLVDTLVRNGETTFSFSPEAGELVRIALGKFVKDSAADFELMLSGYTVEEYRETRRGAGDKTLRPCITALWFCQPFLLRELAGNDEALARGLTARVLAFSCEHDVIPEDDGSIREVSVATRENWFSLVEGALETRDATEPITIKLFHGGA